MCSKFYSLVVSCTAMPPHSPTNVPNGGFVGDLAIRVRCGDSPPRGPHLGEVREWIRYDSLFSSSLKKWIRTDSLRRPAYIFCTIFWIWFCHIHTPSFLICIIVSCNPLEYTFRERKKSPEDLTDFGKALRALYIFSLFYPGVRVHFPRKSWCKFNKNQIIRMLALVTRLCK